MICDKKFSLSPVENRQNPHEYMHDLNLLSISMQVHIEATIVLEPSEIKFGSLSLRTILPIRKGNLTIANKVRVV